jgi:hypothetical protein
MDTKLCRETLSKAQKDSDESLANMEKWQKRETETDEYTQVLRDEEIDWLRTEAKPNATALEIMRSFIPINVAELNVNGIMDYAREKNGLIPLELATEIKNNRLLHWVVTHADDIATANFLYGDKKSYFDNIECLDIIELRAIAVSLPAKFDFDNDGKKLEWRKRFMQRVKQMVSQFNGEKVKGPWDGISNKRLMVDLPALKPELMRRNLYYYRTKEQSDVKLKQYDDKNALLVKKEGVFRI